MKNIDVKRRDLKEKIPLPPKITKNKANKPSKMENGVREDDFSE